MARLIDRQPVTGMQQHRAVERAGQFMATHVQAGAELRSGQRQQRVALEQQGRSAQRDLQPGQVQTVANQRVRKLQRSAVHRAAGHNTHMLPAVPTAVLHRG